MSSFIITSPVNNQPLAERLYADAATLEAAAARAESAQRLWSATPLEERCAKVEALVARLEARRELIADAVTWHMGRPRTQADEMGRLRLVTDTAIANLPDLLRARQIDAGDGITRYVTREPIGPCLSICAWNYPVAMMASLVILPLLAGNVVLLKHAPQTAGIGDFLNQAADEAGLPSGTVAALDITHQDCETLIASGRFPLVQFIGSTRGGRQVARAAGAGMARAGLELGGSDPAYIRPDVDVDAIVGDLVEGCFGNAGQSCCAVERLYVHADIHDRFVEAFVQAARIVTVQHPLDAPGYIGPVVSTDAARRIRAVVSSAIKAGAQEILPSGPSPLAGDGSAYVEPRILAGVTQEMDLVHEEIFGPVAPIIKVSGDDEAVRMMNDSAYGLTASVWTADIERGVALGRAIQSGTFYLNRCDHADINLPWTGTKQSGIGSSYAIEGFQELTMPRAWHVRPAR